MEPNKYFKDHNRKTYILVSDDSDGTVMGKLFQNYKTMVEHPIDTGTFLLKTIDKQIDDHDKMWITDMHFWEPYNQELIRMSEDHADGRKKETYRIPSDSRSSLSRKVGMDIL